MDNNKKNLKMSMDNFNKLQLNELPFVNNNNRRLMLRACSPLWPEGRLTNRMKGAMRKKVTVVDKEGKVVREPNMEAMKKFDKYGRQKEIEEVSNDCEDGMIEGEEAPIQHAQVLLDEDIEPAEETIEPAEATIESVEETLEPVEETEEGYNAAEEEATGYDAAEEIEEGTGYNAVEETEEATVENEEKKE